MGYNFWLTVKKVAIISAEVIVAGLIVYYTERPEYLALVPILEGFRNYLKHKDKV
jgi:hypothetical protein